ncbi:hypothetical protein [Hydrogenophaga sp.]|uniref:hypothetical protein n=1 Tax=Hydrogenophaga sp. TaxID=1904254 RepID=UPI0025BCBE1E|nr:hypothetical protein [Hydrogenophaga sp.]MBT9462677.1 hypothetical protein [Hydrogenophaga sp.]
MHKDENIITLSLDKSESPHAQKLERKFSKADVHFHHKNYAQQGSNPQELLEAMDYMRMQYTVLSPIPTNLLVQCGSCDAADHQPKPLTPKQMASLEKLWNGGVWSDVQWAEFQPGAGSTSLDIHDMPNYYISDIKIRQGFQVDEKTYSTLIAKDGPLYYNTMVDDQTASAYRALKDEDKHRFDPMVTGLVLGDMRCSEMLIDKLRRNPGVFTGVGEITVYKEWVQEKVGVTLQADMQSRACALTKLMNTCGVIGMPVVLHCDVDVMPWDRKFSGPAHFDNICSFFGSSECKNTTIIWAHAGGLGKYSRIRDGHLDRLRQVLKDPSLSHVHFDLSWDTVAKQLTMDDKETAADPKKIQQLVELLEAYPDRFLFGSDALSPNGVEFWRGTEMAYEVVFKKLKPQTADAIKLGNYQRLIVDARNKVRLYEKYCVDYAGLATDIRQDNGRPEHVKWAVREAIKDAVAYGLALRAHELDATVAAPPKDAQAHLVSLADLRAIATKVLMPKEEPWEKVPTFKPYLDRAPKM